MTTKIPVELSSTPGIVDNSNATAITIDSSEHVGIGHTTPDFPLVVRDATTSNYLKVIGATNGNAGIAFGDDDAELDGGILFKNDTKDLRFFKGGFTEAARIDSSGNVGIGTTSPNHALSVGSTSVATSIISVLGSSSGFPQIRFSDDTSESGQGRVFYDSANDAMGFSTSGSERMRIDSSGRVTMPYQPAFEATVGTAFTGNGTVSGSETFIFSNARVNVGSHYNTSTGIFTAPVTGLYQINYFLNPSSSNVTARYFRAKLIKTSGGTDTDIYNAHCTINNPAGDADYNIVSASGVVSLTANDTLKVVFGSSLATSNYTFYVNLASFSGYLIG